MTVTAEEEGGKKRNENLKRHWLSREEALKKVKLASLNYENLFPPLSALSAVP